MHAPTLTHLYTHKCVHQYRHSGGTQTKSLPLSPSLLPCLALTREKKRREKNPCITKAAKQRSALVIKSFSAVWHFLTWSGWWPVLGEREKKRKRDRNREREKEREGQRERERARERERETETEREKDRERERGR